MLPTQGDKDLPAFIASHTFLILKASVTTKQTAVGVWKGSNQPEIGTVGYGLCCAKNNGIHS